MSYWRRNLQLFAMMAALLVVHALSVGTAHAATINVDTFAVSTLVSQLAATSGAPTASVADGDTLTGVFGGERDLILNHTSGTGQVTLRVDQILSRLEFASQTATRGNFSITWDGNDNNAGSLNLAGPGVDITDAGSNDHLMINATADQPGWSMTIVVHTSATNNSTYNYTESQTIQGVGRTYLIPFTAFTPSGSSGGASFNTVRAVQLSVTGVDDLDLSIDFFESVDVDANLFDFGDLPATYNNTTRANSGAGHLNPGTTIRLGASVDTEADGQPNVNAGRFSGGDDGNGIDDEDGVTFTGNWSGGTGFVTVNASAAGCVSAWIDWSSGGFAVSPDGDFNDLGGVIGGLENVINNQHVVAGNNNFSFPIGDPSNRTIYGRFRIVPDRDGDGQCNDQASVFPTSLASDGEVEDYEIQFNPTAVSIQSFGAGQNDTGMVVALIGALLLGLISTGYLLVRRQLIPVKQQ